MRHPSPVRILSLVRTGLRIASTQTAQPAARLTLHFDTPDGTCAALPALMQWQLKTAERYLIGCTLENQDDARSARQAIRWLETHRRGRSKPQQSESLTASATVARCLDRGHLRSGHSRRSGAC